MLKTTENNHLDAPNPPSQYVTDAMRFGHGAVAGHAQVYLLCRHTYGAGVPTGLGRPSSVAPHTQTHTQLPKPKVPSSHRQTQMQSLAIMRSEMTSCALAVLSSMAFLYASACRCLLSRPSSCCATSLSASEEASEAPELRPLKLKPRRADPVRS